MNADTNGKKELAEKGLPLTNEEQGAANPDENPELLSGEEPDEGALLEN